MALRAGYYGIKRGLKAKLAEIVGAWDQVKNDVDVVLPDGIIANTDLIKDTVGWSGKNLCPNKATTKTTNGITFTVNSDGSITVNGTATADATLFLIEPNEIPLTLNGTYILSAGAVLDNDFKFTMEAPQGTNNNVESSALTKSFNNVAVNNFRIFVRNGKTVNNITIFPMLYNADILDDTYEPYFGSTVETILSDHKTTINAIITAATGAADFAAFKTAMGAITPVTRSLSLTKEDITEEVKEDVEPEKTVTKKRTTKKTEEV